MRHPIKTAIPFPDDRIDNTPWAPNEECKYCADEALVEVAVNESGMEQMGPCPFCRHGFMVEFGYSRVIEKWGSTRKIVHVQEEWPPWGPQGYWHKHSGEKNALEPIVHSEPALVDETMLAELRRRAGIRALPEF